MLKVAVYCSNPSVAGMLRRYMAELDKVHGLQCKTDYYDSRERLVWEMDTPGMYDIVIVYREWDVASILRQRTEHINLVMIAPGINKRLYDIQPCYQIYEPVNLGNFYKVICSAAGGHDRYPGMSFQFGKVRYMLNPHEIIYFENDRRKIDVVSETRRYTVYGNMSDLESRLKLMSRDFVRIQESYIVNLEYVREYSGTWVCMADGRQINISAGRRADMKSRYEEYMCDRAIHTLEDRC